MGTCGNLVHKCFVFSKWPVEKSVDKLCFDQIMALTRFAE
jgi:hypothetical protein